MGRCTEGKNKNRLCLQKIIGLVFSATVHEVPGVRELTRETKSKRHVTVSFAHSTSLTTLIQVLFPSRSVYQQANSPHRHTQRRTQSRAYFQPVSGVSKHLSLPLSA